MGVLGLRAGHYTTRGRTAKIVGADTISVENGGMGLMVMVIDGENDVIDYSHLNALQSGLHREQQRLSLARNQNEIDLRTVWVSQLEKEIAAEYAHLGIDPCLDVDMSDEELMRELMA